MDNIFHIGFGVISRLQFKLPAVSIMDQPRMWAYWKTSLRRLGNSFSGRQRDRVMRPAHGKHMLSIH